MLARKWMRGFSQSCASATMAFFHSICSSVSLTMVLRGVSESFVFLYPGLLLLFWMICGVGVCLAGKPLPLPFPRKIAVLRFSLYSSSTSKVSGIGTAFACQPARAALSGLVGYLGKK